MDGLSRTVSNAISSGTGGMVNELLVQMQSFDQPPQARAHAQPDGGVDQQYLPPERRLKAGKPAYNNILLIAATNRADTLDPALLRPGRFDRRLYFDVPSKQGRLDLIEFFLERKAHEPEMDDPSVRERLAHDTFGYTPVMLEHLFDESLLIALRDGRESMTLDDVYEAKLTDEIGIKQPVVYTDIDRAAVATHEAGPRDRGLLPGQGPPAGGPVDHQAARVARAARARRRGGALHAHAHRGRGRHRDRAGRSGGRGALPRRERDRARRPTWRTRPAWPRRWSARSAWPAR